MVSSLTTSTAVCDCHCSLILGALNKRYNVGYGLYIIADNYNIYKCQCKKNNETYTEKECVCVCSTVYVTI